MSKHNYWFVTSFKIYGKKANRHFVPQKNGCCAQGFYKPCLYVTRPKSSKLIFLEGISLGKPCPTSLNLFLSQSRFLSGREVFLWDPQNQEIRLYFKERGFMTYIHTMHVLLTQKHLCTGRPNTYDSHIILNTRNPRFLAQLILHHVCCNIILLVSRKFFYIFYIPQMCFM